MNRETRITGQYAMQADRMAQKLAQAHAELKTASQIIFHLVKQAGGKAIIPDVSLPERAGTLSMRRDDINQKLVIEISNNTNLSDIA